MSTPLGWLWGMSGQESPTTMREQLRRLSIQKRTNVRRNWLKDHRVKKASEPLRLWLRCTGEKCKRWRKANRYCLRKDIFPLIRCKRCGSKFELVKQERPLLTYDTITKECERGGWYKKIPNT